MITEIQSSRDMGAPRARYSAHVHGPDQHVALMGIASEQETTAQLECNSVRSRFIDSRTVKVPATGK